MYRSPEKWGTWLLVEIIVNNEWNNYNISPGLGIYRWDFVICALHSLTPMSLAWCINIGSPTILNETNWVQTPTLSYEPLLSTRIDSFDTKSGCSHYFFDYYPSFSVEKMPPPLLLLGPGTKSRKMILSHHALNCFCENFDFHILVVVTTKKNSGDCLGRKHPETCLRRLVARPFL